jgi:hypothetical protein
VQQEEETTPADRWRRRQTPHLVSHSSLTKSDGSGAYLSLEGAERGATGNVGRIGGCTVNKGEGNHCSTQRGRRRGSPAVSELPQGWSSLFATADTRDRIP